MTEMRALAPPTSGPSAHARTRGATAARKDVTRFLRKAVQNAGFPKPCHRDKYSRHSSAGLAGLLPLKKRPRNVSAALM